jgi:hypothetical protein
MVCIFVFPSLSLSQHVFKSTIILADDYSDGENADDQAVMDVPYTDEVVDTDETNPDADDNDKQ